MVSRRSVLAATGFGIATAGCLGAPGKDGVDIHAVNVHNDDTRAHTVTVSVADGDGTTVLERTVSLAPGEGTSIGSSVEGAGDYRVTVEGGGDTVRERASEYAESDESCVNAVVRIEDDGEVYLSFRASDSC